jgi:hypothetical protein
MADAIPVLLDALGKQAGVMVLGVCILGAVVYFVRNGNGAKAKAGEDSETIVLLRQIANNTAGIPDALREGREYMKEGRLAFAGVERIEARMDERTRESDDLRVAVEALARGMTQKARMA